MTTWAAIVVALGAAGGCLVGMGVGVGALGKLALAMGLMSGVSFLIAWPFLRNPKSRTGSSKAKPSASSNSVVRH